MSICSTGNPLAGRITCTIKEGCFVSGLSRSTLWKLRKEGKLKSVEVLDRTLLNVRSLLEILGERNEEAA
jgi:hypothetical protein